MLVLRTRKFDQLILGNGVTITIKTASGDNLTLQIDAPKDVSILHVKAAKRAGDTDTRD